MNKNYNPIVHIIPFDLGCVFIDVLSMDNSKNLLFAKKFIECIKTECKKYELFNEIEITDNLKLSYTGKAITHYKCLNCEIADNAICYVRLGSCLYCYILESGIGVFVLADIDGKIIKSAPNQLEKMNIALVSSYKKKISQATILNKYSGKDVFPKYEEIMLQFRKVCWKIVYDAELKKEIRIIRKHSSNLRYKAEGLSYVLSIYVFNQNDINDSEMNYLMYSPIFSKAMDNERWSDINSEIIKNKSTLKENTVSSGLVKVHFSWAGVGVITPDTISSYSDIIKSTILSTVLRAEIYVQSRWFVADNSMDNVNKSMNCSLESLQRIESLTEFCQAELDNEISANMSTIYKSVLEKIIETSEVRKLYKSVISQIRMQKKIKEAHYQDKKSKNRFIANLFLAVFTASSLFKTVLDLISNSFNAKNVLLFGAMMIVAVGTVIWNYKNK